MKCQKRWQRSNDPKTINGKATGAINAYKGGGRHSIHIARTLPVAATMNTAPTLGPLDEPGDLYTPRSSSMDHRSAVMEANRESIAALERTILSAPESGRIDLTHLQDFCPGVFVHTVFLPAGTVTTGQATSTQHFFVVVKGRCTLIDANGGRFSIKAPYLGVTVPGVRRSLHVHEECIWIDIHATELTKADEIAKQFLASRRWNDAA